MPFGRHFSGLPAGAVIMTMLAGCAATQPTSLSYSAVQTNPPASSIAGSAIADPSIRNPEPPGQVDANEIPQANLQVASIAAAPNADPFIVDTGPPQSVDPQGSYYVEFRSRWLPEYGPFILMGHTYVLYGHLDATGNPLDQHFVALYPYGSTLGLIAGTLPIVVPATTVPVWGDREFPTLAVYRVPIDATQYAKIENFVHQRRSHLNWFNVYTENCNFLASQIALLIGLKVPLFTAQPAELYVAELRMLNDKH